MRVEVAQACGLMQWSDVVQWYTVYVEAHAFLRRVDFMKMVMPELSPTSSETEMRAFSVQMADIVKRYDSTLPIRRCRCERRRRLRWQRR